MQDEMIKRNGRVAYTGILIPIMMNELNNFAKSFVCNRE